MKKITFTIPGEPKSKGRPRFSTRGGFVKTYTDSQTASYENLAKLCCREAMVKGSLTRLEGEILAEIKAYYKIPKSTSKKQRIRFICDLDRPCKKPDTDNIAKIILDALNDIAYEDDKQIVVLHVEKHYSDTPSVEVKLEEMEKGQDYEL